ncbi:MAG: hypothetical protein PHX83_01865 [Acidobacteriia bacterium]|nr:hypothetical protein [Terriglobia bacterium]
MIRHNQKTIQKLLIPILVLMSGISLSAKDKINPEELISNHLKAIGPAEKLQARKSCILEGDGAWRNLTGSLGSLSGKAIFVSEDDKIRFNIKFNHTNYPAEQFAFDGKMFDTGFVQVGFRSRLGQFLFDHSVLVKQGLLGGVLSTGWALTNRPRLDAKVSYNGIKKFNGKPAHELRYMPKGAGDLNILLYFDPDTFRHVGSIYRLVKSAQLVTGRPEESARQPDTRWEIEEHFDNFQEVEGLMLPLHWNIHFLVEAEGSARTEWDMNYSKASFNQPVDPTVFKLQ